MARLIWSGYRAKLDSDLHIHYAEEDAVEVYFNVGIYPKGRKDFGSLFEFGVAKPIDLTDPRVPIKIVQSIEHHYLQLMAEISTNEQTH